MGKDQRFYHAYKITYIFTRCYFCNIMLHGIMHLY